MSLSLTNKERMKDITGSIERGIEKYSINNTMLIYMQKPNAALMAGINRWRDRFGHNVMEGGKGIKIIAPTPFKKKIEEEKRDTDTNLPQLASDLSGNAQNYEVFMEALRRSAPVPIEIIPYP